MSAEYTVKTCVASGKGVAAHNSFYPGVRAGHVADMMRGKVVTRMGAKSMFYILTERGLRFVFTADRNRPPDEGAFRLVNVQRDEDKEDSGK